jgi:DNA-binding Xre family transcriptional regulator
MDTDPQQTPPFSIKKLRETVESKLVELGISSKKLSREAELNESAIRDLMTKVDDPRLSTILKLAKRLNMPPSSLWGHLVEVFGTVGAEGIITENETPEMDFVVRAPSTGEDLCAVRVVGNTMFPAHRHGDYLYFDRPESGVAAKCIEQECVVRLLDGPYFLGTVLPGSLPGTHTLTRLDAPPLVNRKLAWAALVEFTMRGSVNGHSQKIG